MVQHWPISPRDLPWVLGLGLVCATGWWWLPTHATGAQATWVLCAPGRPAFELDAVRWSSAGWWLLRVLWQDHWGSWLAMVMAMGPALLARPLLTLRQGGASSLTLARCLAVYALAWTVLAMPLHALVTSVSALAGALAMPAPVLAGLPVLAWLCWPAPHGPPPPPPRAHTPWQQAIQLTHGCIRQCWPWMAWAMTWSDHHRLVMLLVTIGLLAHRSLAPTLPRFPHPPRKALP